MTDAAWFRGPDYSETYVDDFISLGHNLLHISGPTVEDAVQPYVTPKGNILAFNGQIYSLGEFDTPYLARMLDFYGIEYLRNVNGAFAIAWYEKEKGHLTIVRDHYGQKPLFYQLGKELRFSSSIHSLRELLGEFDLHKQGTHNFLAQDRFLPGVLTIYNGIKKLFPGQYITYDVRRKKVISTGDLHDYQLGSQLMNDDETRELIRSSIKQTVINKQRTALLLSGGLDSTTILNCSQDLDLDLFTISSSYEETMDENTITRYYEEYEHAELSASLYGVEWHEAYITKQDISNYNLDSMKSSLIPFFDQNRLVPRYLTYKRASELGAKVIVSGDCGDEIFTGYTGDDRFFDTNKLRDVRDQCRDDPEYSWFPSHVFGNDKINNFLFFKLLTYGEGYNLVSDSLASYFSMESRVPFCYQALVRKILSIPGEYKIQRPNNKWDKGIYKYLLRHIFKDELPKHVTSKNKKTGWASPWDSRDHVKNTKLAKENLRIIKKII